jgi:hypothetical protein
MNGIKIAMTGVVSIIIQFGLAIAAWDGWSAFLRIRRFGRLLSFCRLECRGICPRT